MEKKQRIREEILKKLRAQPQEKRTEKSLKIKEMLFKLEEFKQARVVMLYASFDGEVETWEMIKEALKLGKIVVIPRIEKDKKLTPRLVSDIDTGWEENRYRIRQPKQTQRAFPLDEIDLVVVPGLAFDKYGNRLGRGKGYYDRFLAQLPHRIPIIGLAFDFQLLPRLPAGNLDLAVDRVISA